MLPTLAYRNEFKSLPEVKMAKKWHAYQEDVAAFFRTLGMEAQTNATLSGARTSHDIDVLVKALHLGFEVTWIVECKLWRGRVSKSHVLTLRSIVMDAGADRGILLSESGFQSGAVEAAALTNVRTMTFAELRKSASQDIMTMQFRELHDRIESCKARYWDIPKEVRIEHGLRPDVGTLGYSGPRMIEFASDMILKALRGTYPIQSETLAALTVPGLDQEFANAEQLVSVITPIVEDLDSKITACEAALRK